MCVFFHLCFASFDSVGAILAKWSGWTPHLCPSFIYYIYYCLGFVCLDFYPIIIGPSIRYATSMVCGGPTKPAWHACQMVSGIIVLGPKRWKKRSNKKKNRFSASVGEKFFQFNFWLSENSKTITLLHSPTKTVHKLFPLWTERVHYQPFCDVIIGCWALACDWRWRSSIVAFEDGSIIIFWCSWFDNDMRFAGMTAE